MITSVLLLAVSTVIPYQFAYMVACTVQLSTCAKALHVAREAVSCQKDSLLDELTMTANRHEPKLLQLHSLGPSPDDLGLAH